jgi:hypothetical protein
MLLRWLTALFELAIGRGRKRRGTDPDDPRRENVYPLW